jgi:uncharacterized membrane protein
MNYTLITGPYMIGLLFIIIGLLQKFLPPKNINTWYGYRSAASKPGTRLTVFRARL